MSKSETPKNEVLSKTKKNKNKFSVPRYTKARGLFVGTLFSAIFYTTIIYFFLKPAELILFLWILWAQPIVGAGAVLWEEMGI